VLAMGSIFGDRTVGLDKSETRFFVGLQLFVQFPPFDYQGEKIKI